MIRRVFAFADLPCHASFEAPDGTEVRAPVLHIARGKAVIQSDLGLDPGSVLAVHLEFPSGESFPLTTRIVESGVRGLFVRIEHAGDDEDRRFGSRLIEASERFQAATAASREEARSEIRNSILQRSRTMKSSDLARRSQEVRVLGMGTITRMIEEALEEALARTDRVFEEEARERLLRETEAAFHEKLTTLQAERDGAEEQISALKAELERARTVLEEERSRVIEDERFTVSDAGLVELDEHLGRLIERAIRQGDVDPETEARMREVVARLLDDERQKIGEVAREAQSDSIDLLERKVARLAQTLEKTRKAREIAEQRAAALEASGGGLKGVMQAGLHEEDPARERKIALLKEIVKENKAVHAFVAGQAAGAPPPAPVVSETPGGVKKIAVERVEPPPLRQD